MESITESIFTPDFKLDPDFKNPFEGLVYGDKVKVKKTDMAVELIGYVAAFPVEDPSLAVQPDLKMMILPRDYGNFSGEITISCLSNWYRHWHISEVEYITKIAEDSVIVPIEDRYINM